MKYKFNISMAIAACIYLLATLLAHPEFSTYAGHDAGSQAAYEYWFLNQFQFGKDIVQNVGPYGFINYPHIYTGFLDIPKLAINLSLLISAIVFVLMRIRNSLTPANYFLIFAISLFARNDPFYYFLCFLILDFFATTYYFKESKTEVRAIHQFMAYSGVIIYALLTLSKGTLFFMSISCMGSVVIIGASQGKLKKSLLLALLYLMSVITFWMIANQEISGLNDFAYAMINFSSGYNEAMATFEPRKITLFGIAFLILTISYVRSYLSNLHISNNFTKSIYQLNLAFMVFVAWKHGFVRADGHVINYFYFTFLLISYFACQNISKKSDGSILKDIQTQESLILLLAIVVMNIIANKYEGGLFPQHLERVKQNISFAFNPAGKLETLHNELSANIRNMEYVKNELKGEEVIYLGTSPAFMLYNNWKYIPTPSTISFASWNYFASKKDEDFFKNSNKNFLMLDLKTIDNRLMAQDDSLAQMMILKKFYPVDFFNDTILLKKINSTNYNSNSLEIKSSLKKKLKIGEWINVEAINDKYLWSRIKLDQTTASKLISLLYKPETYVIEVEFQNGTSKIWKFIPRMAEIGFLLNPLITSNYDFINLYRESQNSIKIKRFRIMPHKLRSLSARVAELEISTLNVITDPDIKLRKSNLNPHGFGAYIEPITLTIPDSQINIHGKSHVLFHSPCEILIKNPDRKNRLSLSYAFNPDSYTQTGRTNGVIIELSTKMNGGKKKFFSKTLDPSTNLEERGEKSLNILLPANEYTDLYLSINPNNDASWDQFLISDISF